MRKIRQRFPQTALHDIADSLRAELHRCASAFTPGARIAIAVGSRGIAQLETLVRETVSELAARGMQPFVVPAMGSHGGATSDGQEAVLAELGITADRVGAPIRSSMDVVEIPHVHSPVPVFMDRLAWEADGVLLINRIKPHTSFHGTLESGLAKMAVVGLGKHQAARAMHGHGTRGLREYLPLAAKDVLAAGKILAGLAVVENQRDEITCLRGLLANEILDQEPSLLAEAKRNMPALPCEDIDILVVDEIGKNISGTGMDPNIIGRLRIAGEPEPNTPRIKMIVVAGLSDGSHGNCYGIGLADIITQRVLDKADLASMYANAEASTFLERAKIPLTVDTPREALALALRMCPGVSAEHARIARIRNTLHLEELYVSRSVHAEIASRVTTLAEVVDPFQADGHLSAF